jgi:hypothetical protein
LRINRQPDRAGSSYFRQCHWRGNDRAVPVRPLPVSKVFPLRIRLHSFVARDEEVRLQSCVLHIYCFGRHCAGPVLSGKGGPALSPAAVHSPSVTALSTATSRLARRPLGRQWSASLPARCCWFAPTSCSRRPLAHNPRAGPFFQQFSRGGGAMQHRDARQQSMSC